MDCIVPVATSLALPLLALYLLIRELTVFYFTARPFQAANTRRQFPRFVLSGILMPEATISNPTPLHGARADHYVRDIVVPSTDRARRKMLEEAQSMGLLREVTTATKFQDIFLEDLKRLVFEQTGSDPRSLPEEAAKMEASLARHQRYLRSLVLRYAKAFLLTILTTIVTVTASGTLSLLTNPLTQNHVNASHVWSCMLLEYSAWCAFAIFLVRRPVEWIYQDVPTSEGKRTPQSLLSFERWTIGLAFSSQLVLLADLLAITGDVEDRFQLAPAGLGSALLIFSLIYLIRALRSERNQDKGGLV